MTDEEVKNLKFDFSWITLGEHVQGWGRGLMAIIWAGNLSWDLAEVLLWYEGWDFVGDLASKLPCPAGKSADI